MIVAASASLHAACISLCPLTVNSRLPDIEIIGNNYQSSQASFRLILRLVLVVRPALHRKKENLAYRFTEKTKIYFLFSAVQPPARYNYFLGPGPGFFFLFSLGLESWIAQGWPARRKSFISSSRAGRAL
jgi:hypothetical protein